MIKYLTRIGGKLYHKFTLTDGFMVVLPSRKMTAEEVEYICNLIKNN